MRNVALFAIRLTIFSLASLCLFAANPPQTPPAADNFYSKSLHYTNKGIEYWYAKEQGGIERLTGLPIAKLNCLQSKCHIRTCDTCHRKDVNGKATYSLEQAKTGEACQKCHPLEKEQAAADVHFKRGMKCTSCHNARDIHGDGVAYNSALQPGALDARCENCHKSVNQTASHTVHGGKVDCTVCHVREYPTCYNCHLGARLDKGVKDVSLPLKGIFFMVNHNGKVKLANFLTYVYQNKTMITFAPWFSHFVTKDARKCGECHNTAIVQDIKNNRFKPVRWENGGIQNVQGVVPVLAGMKWDLVYLDYQDGKWTPLTNPSQPLINYSGYCTPLTSAQFAKLEKGPAGK